MWVQWCSLQYVYHLVKVCNACNAKQIDWLGCIKYPVVPIDKFIVPSSDDIPSVIELVQELVLVSKGQGKFKSVAL